MNKRNLILVVLLCFLMSLGLCFATEGEDTEAVETSVSVTGLSVDTSAGSVWKVAFTLASKMEQSIRYQVSVVTKDGLASEVLYEGEEAPNTKVECEISLQDFGSEEYAVQVYAYVLVNGTESSHSAQSEFTAYSNANEPEACEEYLVKLFPLTYTLSVDWSEMSTSYDEVLVGLFANEETEPFSYVEAGSYDATSTEGLYGTEDTKLTVEFSYRDEELFSKTSVRNVDLSAIPMLTLNEEALATTQYEVPYTGFAGQELQVTVENADTEESGEPLVESLTLDGSGSFLIALGEYENQVQISYLAANGVQIVYEKAIYVNLTTPVISLDQTYENMTVTSESITLSGEVLGAKTLTINGTECSIDANGSFVFVATLIEGENEIRMEASNALDGKTVRDFSITYVKQGPSASEDSKPEKDSEDSSDNEGDTSWFMEHLALIISCTIGIACVIVAVVMIKKKK